MSRSDPRLALAARLLAVLLLGAPGLPLGAAAQDRPAAPQGEPPAARPAEGQRERHGRPDRRGERPLPPPDDFEPGDRPPPLRDDFEPGGWPPPPWGPPPGRGGRFERLLSAGGFEPGPEDRGPLSPGEAEALTKFAQERLPFVARMLNELPPEAAQRRMAEMAPRLRHLQRMFGENPSMAKKLVDHGRNMMMMQQLGARVRAADRPMQRRRLMNSLRDLNRANFELETEMLSDSIELLGDETRRGKLIERYLDEVLAPEADLSDEPPPVRRAAERFRDASSEEEREKVRSQMRTAIGRRADEHRERLQDRFERRLADADREIERRTRDAAEGRPPRPHPGDFAAPPPPPPGP